jgi:hypothetical protein
MNNPIPTIKRVILRAIHAAGNQPVPEATLVDAVNQVVVPKPLASDFSLAKRELQDGGFIQGARDSLDETLVTWTLTPKGTHKAIELSQ